MLKRLGLRFDSVTQAGGHYKVTVSKGEVIKKVTFPVSPSDRRWINNMESFLKKTFEL